MTEKLSAPSITEGLARYAVARSFDDLPEEVVEIVRRSLVDTLGVVIAGRHEDAVRILQETVGGGEPSGSATILFDGGRTDAATAALLNGTAGHVLDFDDVTDLTYGHPSVVLWPAILAAAEQEGATGREIIEAFVVGFEVQCAIALGMDVREHYGRGWHSTATIGVVSAAAAVSRLMGLGVDTTRQALGLAGSMAGGSRQNFGSMTKPLHPGLAARDGVFAAGLASRGFTADASLMESPLGFYSMFTSGLDPQAVLDSLNGPWALVEHGINVKKYPCCFNTHRTADATLDMVTQHGLSPDEVTAIRLTLEPGGFDPLIHHRPATGLQGKFSGEYVIAASLLDGRVGLESFTDAAVGRPDAQRLISLVEWSEAAVPPIGPPEWSHAYSVVRISTARGDFELRSDLPRGDRRLPLTREDLEAKFRDCLTFSGTGWDADELLTQLWGLGGPDLFKGLNHMGPMRRPSAAAR
jgi:2-methylcitrate dehydratase PrpD